MSAIGVMPLTTRNEYVPILRRINEQCTPVQQEWIIRIILKGQSVDLVMLLIPSDLRISMREKGVLGCLHPEAGTLFNVCSDLKRVCWTLYKPEIHLEQNVGPLPRHQLTEQASKH